MSLYEIGNRFLEAVNYFESGDCEIDDDTITDTLNSIEGEFEEKAINVAKYIRNLEADVEAIKAAEKEMKERRDSMQLRADKLRTYLKDNMKALSKLKISSPWFVIAIKNNPESTVITDQSKIPAAFINEKITYTPDKTAIKAAIKGGEIIEGAALVKSDRVDIK